MARMLFDRARLRLYPLSTRDDRMRLDRERITPATEPGATTPQAREAIALTADRMRRARSAGRPVVLAFGAHAIKNGLGPVLIRLLETGWVQHLATNGAGIIHDWELAFQGQTSEHVGPNVRDGRFGLWQETGLHLNLALALGAYDGLGYGESIGRLIAREGHEVPPRADLLAAVARAGRSAVDTQRAGGAADLLAVLDRTGLEPGTHALAHPWHRDSAQAAAFRLDVPFTAHPMFGHDIIYTHPASHGAAIGRTAERDFLAFAHQIAGIEGGVYLTTGSAVMSPMIFEKSLSMAQNMALQAGRRIENHFIVVVDLAESRWEWGRGEPPESSPDYYLRYCKTFSRMGGTMRYVSADNRAFLLWLCRELGVTEEAQEG